jgi:hypothetical protein
MLDFYQANCATNPVARTRRKRPLLLYAAALPSGVFTSAAADVCTIGNICFDYVDGNTHLICHNLGGGQLLRPSSPFFGGQIGLPVRDQWSRTARLAEAGVLLRGAASGCAACSAAGPPRRLKGVSSSLSFGLAVERKQSRSSCRSINRRTVSVGECPQAQSPCAVRILICTPALPLSNS